MNISEARKFVGQKQMGLGSSFDGSAFAYAALEPSEQVSLNKKVADYIVGNPSLFTTEQVNLSSRISSSQSSGLPLANTSFDFSMFGDEVLNNAREINPFDITNIKTVGFYLLGAALVLGVAYVYINKRPNT